MLCMLRGVVSDFMLCMLWAVVRYHLSVVICDLEEKNPRMDVGV
jgi:hypothetical protein